MVDALIESGDIKVWNAQEILKRVQNNTAVAQGPEPRSYASGKIILLGEHAVVYGRPALAAPIPLAVEARVVDSADTVLLIPRWGIEQRVPPMSENPQGVTGVLALLLERLDLASRSLTIEAFPNVPRAMGLGGSSALAVAVIRALSNHFKLDLSDERVNELAFECERAVHGTPSGVDNTIATYGSTLLFENKGAPSFQEVHPARSVSIAIGISGKESLTATTVARVRRAWERQPQRYERIFDQIGDLTRAGTEALQDGAYQELGELMNLCHGYLNALQVSTPELEELIHIARRRGAVGAKLTGGGGGGSVIALCPDGADDVVEAMQNSGFEALAFDLA